MFLLWLLADNYRSMFNGINNYNHRKSFTRFNDLKRFVNSILFAVLLFVIVTYSQKDVLQIFLLKPDQ